MLADPARRQDAGRAHGDSRPPRTRGCGVSLPAQKVPRVFYPGLKDHPQHELASRQMSGFGSMITFETGSLKNANKMLRKVRVCSLGESLGGVETLISHPATMTHAALGEEGRKAIGITDGMVRISVGIEDVDDILADLDEALS